MMLKLVVVEVVVFLATLAPSTHSSTHYGARGRAQIARERAQIARQWAPLVWLHPEEEFYPDSVPAFLAHITPSIKVDGDGVEVDEGVATFIVPPLPMGGGSHESFLNVNHNFECGVCSLPRFLHGRQPDEHYVPPVYTVIHSCDPPPYRSRDGRSVTPSQLHTHTLTNIPGNNGVWYKGRADTNLMDSNISTEATSSNKESLVSNYMRNNNSSLTNNSAEMERWYAGRTKNNIENTSYTMTSNSSNGDEMWHEDQTQNNNRTRIKTSPQNPQTYASTKQPYKSSTTLTSIIFPPQNYPINIREPITDGINVRKEKHTLNFGDDAEVTSGAQSSYRDSRTQLNETIPTPGELEVERSSEDSEYPMFEDAQRIPKELQPGSEEDYEYLQAEDTFPASSEIQQPSSEGESEDRFHMSRELWPGKEDYSEYEDLEPGNETNQHRATRTPLRTPAEQHTFTVTYWMFYPYNRGKPVCSVNLGYFLGRLFKPRDKRGGCHGEEVIMGDHVGEWEHVSIQFKGSTPTQMYVSTHTFGAYYTYDHQQGHFVYSDEDVREGLPLPIPPQYPRTVHLVGTRPVLYSSKGSHGLWAAAGVHHYSWIPLLLDETGKGTPWKTWKNMHIIDLKEPETLTHHRSWWGYEGRWGNPSERCHLLMGTQCEMNQGPTGIPRKRIIFPCSHPNP